MTNYNDVRLWFALAIIISFGVYVVEWRDLFQRASLRSRLKTPIPMIVEPAEQDIVTVSNETEPIKIEKSPTIDRNNINKYLVVNSICEGLNVAKSGLLELLYLAKESGRILVEPQIGRLTKYENSERQLGFGYASEERFGEGRSFREYYDIKDVLKIVKVKMITFEDYLEQIDRVESPSSVDFQFESPWKSHSVPPSCTFADRHQKLHMSDPYYAMFHGFGDTLSSRRPNLKIKKRVICVKKPQHSISAPEAIKTLKLDSITTSIIVSHYVARSTFVQIPNWRDNFEKIKEWDYTDRLYQLAKMVTHGQVYAAMHLRVVKMFQQDPEEAKICAGRLLDVVSDQLRSRNMTSIYIASDLVPDVDGDNPAISPYVDFITNIGDEFLMIESVDRMDVDRDFVDQILCVSSDFFLFASGNSPLPEHCTSWSSHYTDYILTNRPKVKGNSFNVSPKL